MQRALIIALVGITLPISTSAALAAELAKSPEQAKGPTEKLCENHGALGRRLAVRCVCATRAEWAERRQREWDIIDRTRTQRCAIDPMTGLCS